MGTIQDTWNCQSVSLIFGFVLMNFHFIHIYKPDQSVQGYTVSDFLNFFYRKDFTSVKLFLCNVTGLNLEC